MTKSRNQPTGAPVGIVRYFADADFHRRSPMPQWNAWEDYYTGGAQPPMAYNGRRAVVANKPAAGGQSKDKTKKQVNENSVKGKGKGPAKTQGKTSASKEEQEGKAAQAALLRARVLAIQETVPGAKAAPSSGEDFTLGTRTFKITHVLTKGEVATQVEVASALTNGTLTGKPCGWFICLRSQNYELVCKITGGIADYQVVPARSCITQVNSISMRCTTDEFPVVFTTGVPGATTDQMGNLEAVIFSKEVSHAGPAMEHHSTKYHNIKPGFKQGHERMSVTRPYGADAGMLYTVGSFYAPATYNMSSNDGTSVGFVTAEVKVRTYERDVTPPTGYSFVEEDLIQVVPVYDPTLLISGGYQDSHLGGEIVGGYDIAVKKGTSAGTFAVSLDSESLVDMLAPAVTYEFHDGFDRNVKTTATQAVAQPMHFKYMRLCSVNGGPSKVHVFSNFDNCVNARAEVGYLDEGSWLGTEQLTYRPVTGSWGSAYKGDLTSAYTKSIDMSTHGKKPGNYTVTKAPRHPSTVGPLPTVLSDHPDAPKAVKIQTTYAENTAVYKK